MSKAQCKMKLDKIAKELVEEVAFELIDGFVSGITLKNKSGQCTAEFFKANLDIITQVVAWRIWCCLFDNKDKLDMEEMKPVITPVDIHHAARNAIERW